MQEGLRNKELQVVKLDKRAYHGEEIDLDKYLLGGKDHPYLEKLDALSDENKQDMLIAGIDISEKERTGRLTPSYYLL